MRQDYSEAKAKADRLQGQIEGVCILLMVSILIVGLLAVWSVKP